MKLPTSVYVHGVDWTIEVDELALAEEGYAGMTDYQRQTITMSERYPTRARVTLLHELLHVVGDVLDGENRLSELQVKVLAVGLTEAIFDNPKVLKFLEGAP
jgi:hypothetical protein